MPRKVKHSETIQGYYQRKDRATAAAREARRQGLGARVKTSDWAHSIPLIRKVTDNTKRTRTVHLRMEFFRLLSQSDCLSSGYKEKAWISQEKIGEATRCV